MSNRNRNAQARRGRRRNQPRNPRPQTLPAQLTRAPARPARAPRAPRKRTVDDTNGPDSVGLVYASTNPSVRNLPTHDLPPIGRSGYEWAAANTNPFRNGGRIKDIVPRFPDGSGNTLGFCINAKCQVLGSDHTEGYISMVAPNSSLPQIICTSYDTSASITVGTGTVTVTTYTDITENAIVQPILNYPNRFRVVAAGLKANFAGALTEGSGTFNAGWFPGNIRNTGGFLPHSYYSRHINSEVYQCREGITVSMPVSTESLLFYPAQAVTADARHGGWPFIIYRGLSATSVIQVNAIMYLEVILPPASIPFSLGSTDCEQALAPILAFANASDRVVSGHSFKSLASLLGNRMKGAFRFVSDNWGVINAAGQLAARALAL